MFITMPFISIAPFEWGSYYILLFINGMITGIRMIMQSRNTQAAPPNLSTTVYCGPVVAIMKRAAAIRDAPVYIIALIAVAFFIWIL
jgi:hypothetical protein